MSIARTHENYSHDWWTPPEWIDWVDETYLGKSWYDPCPRDWSGEKLGAWKQRNYCNHPGSRNSTVEWWESAVKALNQGKDVIWCAFSDEQQRHMRPSPHMLPGWLVMPRSRTGFIWGGANIGPGNGKVRKHGERSKSPGNWTVFWSSVRPAPTPVPCVIVQTGRTC